MPLVTTLTDQTGTPLSQISFLAQCFTGGRNQKRIIDQQSFEPDFSSESITELHLYSTKALVERLCCHRHGFKWRCPSANRAIDPPAGQPCASV